MKDEQIPEFQSSLAVPEEEGVQKEPAHISGRVRLYVLRSSRGTEKSRYTEGKVKSRSENNRG